MSLLPAKFQDTAAAMSLGPVVKPKTETPVPHVCDWRPVESSKDHVLCECGAVALREFVMPPAPVEEQPCFDPGEDDQTVVLRDDFRGSLMYAWSRDAFRQTPRTVIYPRRPVASDSAWEQARREDELAGRLRTKHLASWAR